MIKAARLRERNPQLGFGIRTYTTASTGTKYTAGHVGKPSPLRIVADIRELEEIQGIPQFEVMEFHTADALHEKLQIEMEERSRLGQPAVRAEVISEIGELDAPISPLVADRSLDDITPNDKPQPEDEDPEVAEKPQPEDEDPEVAEKPQPEDEDTVVDKKKSAKETPKNRSKSAKTKKSNKGRKARK